MPRGANRHTTAISSKSARNALASLLRDCRPEKLAEFTAAGLSAMFNVSPSRAEVMLAEARERRGHEV